MDRQCGLPSCINHISGLHQDPAEPGIRHHWLAMLRLSDRDLPPRAGVCHFFPGVLFQSHGGEHGFQRSAHAEK